MTKAAIGMRLGLLILALFLPQSAAAAELYTGLPVATPGIRGNAVQGTRINVRVKSLQELKWRNVVRQQLDIGCGAAALATILTYYFDFPVTEEEMFNPLMTQALRGAGPDVRLVGFNLRHIRNVAAQGGLVGAAFHVSEENLHRIRIPAIARITVHGYDHFAVFKEARGGRVYLADPAFGNTSYRLPQFKKIWSGVLMGFVRRTRVQDLPQDHLLKVRPEDQRSIEADELMRLARADLSANQPHIPVIVHFDTFPFIQPSITGTGSIFPKVIGSSQEF